MIVLVKCHTKVITRMKKKFKIIDTSTGQKLKLREKEMLVMNDQGLFFIVGNFMDYDTYVRKLSDV